MGKSWARYRGVVQRAVTMGRDKRARRASAEPAAAQQQPPDAAWELAELPDPVL